jgi:VWFA-related protein
MSQACRLFVATLSLLLFFAATPATQIPQLGETMDVSIINVDVFVTGADGRRVHGLTRNDFEVYENGVLQPISNFAEYSGVAEDGVAAVEGRAEAPPRQPRTIAIFFERMRIEPFTSDPMIAAIREVIKKNVAAGDAVSLVIWDRFSTTNLSFTDDLSKIDAALTGLSDDTKKLHLDLMSGTSEEVSMLRQFERQVAARAGSSGPAVGPTLSSSAQLAMLLAMHEMKMRVAAINSVINSMAGGEGKKILLLAPRRLGEIAGAEFAYLGTPDVLPADAKLQYGTEGLLRSIAANANSNGVTIYPLFPAGFGSSLPQPATNAYLNETVSLKHLAQETGGLTALTAKDVVTLMPQVSDDVSDYYSLAYRVGSTGDDRARDIVVKTKNRDLRVRSRRQFVEKSYERRMKDRLTATLFRTNQESPIVIVAQLGKAKKVRNKNTIPVRIRIPIAALTALPQGEGKHAGAFSVFVGTAADLDEVSNVTQKTQRFEIAEADLKKAGDGYFTYDLDLVVNPQAKFVAVGVLDEVSKSYGTQRLDLPGHAPKQAAR